MTLSRWIFPWALTLAMAGFSTPLALSEEESVERIPNFSLFDQHGNPVTLYDSAQDQVGTVLAWTSLDCMVAKLYLPRLVEMAEEYGEEGIRFYGVDPNIQDKPEEVIERLEKVGVDFTFLMDPMQAVTDSVEIVRTTEVLLLDRHFNVVYRGAIDDQYNVGASKPFPRHEWLVDAMESLLADEEIETPKTEPSGCLVGRIVDRSQIELNFYQHIAPIVNRHCVECHRPDQIGPMTLLDAEEVRGWAPMIAEVVGDGRMPPWHANPMHGDFANRRTLTETEKQQLIVWAANGAPLGDVKDAPPTPTFQDEGWAIGKPDYIVELPQVQEIPATGVVDYRYVIVDPKFTEDHWVQATEIRPTSTTTTHHVLVLPIPPGNSARQSLRDSDDEDSTVGGGYFSVQVPGCRPSVYPEGMGKFVEAGTRFLFQLHYTPTGVKDQDRTRMAFRWCDEVPDIEVKTTGIYHQSLDIPPGEGAVSFTSQREFARPIHVLSVFPHMHARGASFRMERIVGGTSEIVLDIPRYDFNWQNFYRPRTPLFVDSGEALSITAVFDNSESNPLNPDPTARVRWGDQTFEEMLIGFFDYIEDVDTKLPR